MKRQNLIAQSPAFESVADPRRRIALAERVRAAMMLPGGNCHTEQGNCSAIAVGINVCEAERIPYTLRADPETGAYRLTREKPVRGTEEELLERRRVAVRRLKAAFVDDTVHQDAVFEALTVVTSCLPLADVERLAAEQEKKSSPRSGTDDTPRQH